MMNILDVCCALIELPSAQGTLLLGAKKKAGQSNGLFYEFPGGKVEPEQLCCMHGTWKPRYAVGS